VSSQTTRVLNGSFGLFLGATLVTTGLATAGLMPCRAQYPGQVTKGDKETPELRSIAVLEWTGDEGKPKNSRLVPVAVLDGGELQDGTVYLARPEPLALAGGVEYELEENGKPIGLYDVRSAGQQLGTWVGFGAWKPMVTARPKPAKPQLAESEDADFQAEHPVLHRKHHADDSSSSGGTDQSAPAAPSDPDRPTLHKKTDSSGDSGSASPSGSPNSSGSASSTGTAGSSGSTSTSGSGSTASDPDKPTLHKRTDSPDDSNSTGTTDPDRPTLHKKASSDDSSASSDPDRPVLKKPRKKQEDEASVDSVADAADPDRPRLKRGKSDADSIEVAPSLKGLPADVEQTVAVSDARNHPEHPWTFSWASPDDEDKMKSALEGMARDALGLTPPPARPAAKKTAARKSAKRVAPAPLLDERFQVFELAYGSGATLVLSARTDAAAAQVKYVTLIAQPDLYGNVLVLLKSVTDGAHLDDKPRMRLVDAVDAMADNRGELLFELRGSTQRQFALYRVLRGQAEKVFASGGAEFGSE